MYKYLLMALLALSACSADMADDPSTDEPDVAEIQELASSTTHPDTVYLTVPAISGWSSVTSQIPHVSGTCNTTGCQHGYQGAAPFYESQTSYPNDCVLGAPNDYNGMWCQNGNGPDHRVWVNCPGIPTPSPWATITAGVFEGWSAWTSWWFVKAVPSYVRAQPVTVPAGTGIVRVDCKFTTGGSTTFVMQHL